jgi:hypothetical protein
VKDAGGREWLKAPADDLLVLEEGNMLPGRVKVLVHLVSRRVMRRMSATRAVLEASGADFAVVRREDPLFVARTTYRLVPNEPEVQVVQEILGWRGRDTLLRVAYPTALSGLRPLFETNGAVVGRAFARDVDAFDDPWTLDNVAWRWAALDAPATIVLGARDWRFLSRRSGSSKSSFPMGSTPAAWKTWRDGCACWPDGASPRRSRRPPPVATAT